MVEFEKLKLIEKGYFKGWWQYGVNRLSPELYNEITKRFINK